MSKKAITTVAELRAKALDALDRAKRAPRFILDADDKRWLAAVARRVKLPEWDAERANIINEYQDPTS